MAASSHPFNFDRRSLLKALAGGGLVLSGWPRSARAEDGPLIELTSRPPNYESVVETFTQRFTPIDRFYVRNHFDRPEIDRAAWRLEIRGLVDKPLSLSLAELTRMKQTTVEAVLQCAGNGRALFHPRVAGVQWTRGAMGNAEWTGVKLRDLFARAHPTKAAKFLELSGADKPSMNTTPAFIRGIPLEKALHPDTLVALKMNGAPLPLDHGFPARLVVPGWVADDWVKWLSLIEVKAEESTAFFYQTGYRYPREPGPPGQPVPPEGMIPMTELAVKSLIASPANGASLPLRAHTITGVAFSGTQKIVKVEISSDGGATWKLAKLDGPETKYGFRVFHFDWAPTKTGRHKLVARATDAAGRAQPESPVWNPSGYLYNALDPIEVEVVG